MKIRTSYVSNSSSSSFVIINWNCLDEAKKNMVLNYGKYVRELWQKHNLPISHEHGDHLDSQKICGEHFIKEDAGIAYELDFGWIDDWWRFREQDGVLDMTTSMDNFNMQKWMDYIGGIKYRWCGESWGFFSDEKVDSNSLEWLDNLLENGNDK